MLIYQDEVPRFIKTQAPIHIFAYHPHAVLHLNSSIYHSIMKLISYYQYISQHSKPQCDKYLISRIQNMATFRGPLEWDPATSLNEHTISSY